MSSAAYNKPWWHADKGGVGKTLVEQFCQIDKIQSHHRQRNLAHLRLYSNRLASTMSGVAFAQYSPFRQDRLRLNVVQAVIDAATAQAASNDVRVMPLSRGGDWESTESARRLQLYLDGQFHRLQQAQIAIDVFRDAAIFGTGIEKVWGQEGRVMAERVLPDNVVVDDIDGQDGAPRSMYQYAELPREVVQGLYGKGEGRTAKLLRQDHWGRHRLTDPVSVVEAWHLPSSREGKDGRHVIATSDGTLLDEKWTRQRFPIIAYTWKRPFGWYGIGMAEELMPIQVELNYVLQKKQRILWHASHQIWVKRGSVQQTDLDNDEATIRQFDETPPIALPINTGTGELDAHADNLYRKAFETVGVSMLQAQAQKPAGLSSGEALRAYNDMGSARFMHVLKQFERMHVKVAQAIVDAEHDMLERGEKSETISVSAGNKAQSVKFSEIDIDEDLQLQVFPASMLPATPAGKIQMLNDLAGLSPVLADQLIAQLNFPDTERAIALATAPVDIADKAISLILRDGKRVAPEPFWDLALTQRRAQAELLRAQVDGAPEDRISLLREFVARVVELQKRAAAAAQPAPEQPYPQGVPQQ